MADIELELNALRKEIDHLKSRDTILQHLTRYGRGQEWMDVTLMNEVFFEDAAIDFGFFKGVWRDYRPFLMELESNAETTFHMLAAPQVEFEHDERAYVECYGIAGGRNKGETHLFGGRYFLIFERRRGVWKSASCTYVLDWTMEQSGDGAVEGPLNTINRVTDRSPNNPLFRRMGMDVTG